MPYLGALAEEYADKGVRIIGIPIDIFDSAGGIDADQVELARRYGIAIQFDETAAAPFFHYTDENSAIHEVWFEDARSMDVKLRLIAEYGFQGGGIWNLMRPFSQIWLLLDALYEIDG